MKYRREVDGLRAIAIVPVIFFHAGFLGFSGGYVGVDVFFVISGYLITTILATELTEKNYSIAYFYERRARRILPALFVMLLCSLLMAYLLLNPADLRDYAKSLLGAVLFVANITTYMQSGYFDSAIEVKPLMHLWSLAIEEQYYLFFPLLLALVWRFQFRVIYVALGIVTVFSLWVSEVKLSENPSIAFFYLHSRAWELGLGALVALALLPNGNEHAKRDEPTWLCQSLALLGFSMVVFAVVWFDKATRFPGLSALVPTLGATLILLFAKPKTWVGQMLSTKPLVMVGLLSYSAYLWHQPIFAFARYRSPNHLSNVTLVGLVVLTFMAAYLSWRWVEAPFRQKNKVSQKAIAFWSSVGIVVFAAIAILVNAKQGFPERYPAEYAAVFDPYKVKEGKFCGFKKISNYEDIEVCEFGDLESSRTVLLFGDSHASSLLGELDHTLGQAGIKGMRVRLLRCQHPVPGLISGEPTADSVSVQKQCLENFQHFVSYLASDAEAVVVSMRWSIRLYPVAGLLDDSSFDNQEGGVEFHKNPALNMALIKDGEWTSDWRDKKKFVESLIHRLSGTGKKVFVIYPVPEIGWDLPRYNFATYLQTGQVKPQVSTSYALYKQRNQFITTLLDEPQFDEVIRIRPEDFFCKVGDGTRCFAQQNWQPYYYDSNHLASEGAKPIAQEIGRLLATSAVPSKLLSTKAPAH